MIRKAHEINQELFNIIIRFCTKVIDSEITSIESLKEYILNEVSKYSYKMPQEAITCGITSRLFSKDNICCNAGRITD